MSFKIFHKFFISLFCCNILFLIGCAPKLGGNDYDVSGVGEISTTLKGVITATKTVMLRPDNFHEPKTGAVLGAFSGAAVGSTIGGGNKMPLVSAALGGIAGGIAGHAIEQKISEQKGVEYQIKLSNGKLISIAQGLEPKLSVGQKVLIIKSNRSRSRVVADNATD